MKKCKKILCLFLALVMCLGMVNLSAFAEETAHEHNTDGWECVYTDPVKKLDCQHVHNQECGYAAAVEGTDCTHTHNEECGYVAPVEGVACDHVHDENCGYKEAVACTCNAQPNEDGNVVHYEGCAYVEGSLCNHKCSDGSCAYVAAVEGSPCIHTHDENCGYVEAKAEVPCTHEHTDECYKVVTEGYWTCTAPAEEETPVPVTDEAGLAAAFEGDQETIVLGDSFTVSSTITVNRDVTLDLNGKTLTYSEPSYTSLFTVESTGTLTIRDTSEQGVAETISYEVMTSKVTGSGTTTETTETRTIEVPQSGKILLANPTGKYGGKNNGVINVNGGTLYLESGTIDCAAKSISHGIVVDGGTVNMSGGAIVNGMADWYQNGGGILVKTGTLNLSGGVIARNFAEGLDAHAAGGGVCVLQGTLNMTGGAIADNRGVYWGGGIALENGALNISGGVIANNTSKVGGGIAAKKSDGTIDISGNAVIAENSTKEDGNGGGVSVDGSGYTVTIRDGALITKNTAKDGGGGIRTNGSRLEVEGGQITGNEAHTGGGIDTNNFLMTGGIIAGNIALGDTDGELYYGKLRGDGEGGGIRVGGGSAEITGGYITNNETRTTVDWGGGGIFVSMWATAEIQNLLVTGNEAQGLGGGVGGCSTGQVAISATDGLASFGNTAAGDKGHGAHAAHKPEDQAALKNDDFLYYGSNDFFCANSSYVTDAMLGGGSANWHGSKDSSDYDKVNNTIEVQQLAIPQGGAAATAHLMGLSAAPSDEAKTAAYSAAKVFITGNKSSTHGGGIMCNGTMFIGAIEGEGEPKFSSVPVEATKVYTNADGSPIELKGGEFTFALVKADDFMIVDGKPSYDMSCVQTAVNDANGKVLFTINDLTEEGNYTYYLVEVPGNQAVKYDSTIYKVTVKVTLGKDISWTIDGVKLTATVYNGEVTGITAMEIEDGELVQKDPVESAQFTNTYSGELTVTKVWTGDDDSAVRPESIQVQLYKNGKAENDPVVLSTVNNWTYKWTGLSQGAEYTVKELNVPQIYTASYSKSGSVVTITNTYTAPEAPKTGDLKLVKELADNASNYADAEFTFEVTLTDQDGNGLSGKFGDIEFKSGEANVKVSKNEPVTITGIPYGTKYTVEEIELPDGWVQQDKVSGELNSNVDVTITNSRSGGGSNPDPTPEPTYTSLTVTKVWDDDNDSAKARPDSVTVQLLRNGKPSTRDDAVQTLDETNDWSCKWSNLSDSYKWSVMEIDVPTGYTDKVTQSGTKWTITNTYTETDIPDKETPTTDAPEEPTDTPDEQTPVTDVPDEETPKTDIPDEPVDVPDVQPPLVDLPDEQPPLVDIPVVTIPEEQVPTTVVPVEEVPLADIPDEDVPMVGIPQTGDFSMVWYAAAILSAMGLAVLTLKKREDEEG